MSLHEYQESIEIDSKDYTFYSLIMAAIRKADDGNLARLRMAFPETYNELKARYNAPGGLLEESKMITNPKVGDKVHYQPSHYLDNEFGNGIIKEAATHKQEAVRVVYKCDNDWDNYTNYSSALTYLKDLKPGWRT